MACLSRRKPDFLLMGMLALLAPATLQAQTRPADADLGAVTVTSTRMPRPVLESPATVTVIDDAQMERELMQDIRDTVRYEPGVSVGSNPGRFGPNGFTIRGIGGNRVLMQVDGIRVPDAFSFGSFGTASRNMVDIDALKSMEILRGPGSSLYGSDAIGGVVSFITKDPADFMRLTDKPVFASLKGGVASADESWFTTGAVASGRGDLQSMLVYTHRKGHETENMGEIDSRGPTRTKANPQKTTDDNVLAKVALRVNSANSLKLTTEFYGNDTATDVLTLNPQTPRTTTLLGEDTAQRSRISLEHEHKDGDGTLFQLARTTLYWQLSDTSQSTFEQRAGTTATCSGVTAGPNTCNFYREFYFVQNILGANVQFEKLFGTGAWSHQLVYGGDYSLTDTDQMRNARRVNITTGVATSNIPPDNFPVRDFPMSDTTLAGAFVQDEARHGRWSIIPGLRYDYYQLDPKVDAIYTADNPGVAVVDKKEQALSPKLGLLYRATPQTTLYGQYAHGFRAPPYNDVNVGFTNVAFGYTAIPNPDLKAEKSRGVEGGVRYQSRSSSFSFAGFYNRYSDFISSLQQLNCPADPRCVPGFAITFQSVNLANVRIGGLEARAEHSFDSGFGVIGAWSWAEGEDIDRRQPINSIDPMNLVAGLNFVSRVRSWGAQFAGTFVQQKKHIDKTLAPVPPASPRYNVFDLIAYWNLSKQLSANFGLFNLFDEKYFLWPDMQGVGAGTAAVPTSATIDRYSQPGRNARASLKYQF